MWLEITNLICYSVFDFKVKVMLRPTIIRPVCLGIKHPHGAYDQIFITVRWLRVCWCGALSLTGGRVCRLQLLVAHTNAVILGPEFRGTRDLILLSQIRDFPFHRLLRLTGLRCQSQSQLLYDWRFTANQFVLAQSPLRLTATIFLIEHVRS
jgi:hypothetical protein